MNARDPQLPLQPDEASALGAFASRRWDEAIVPALTDYIAIPAKSPMFDADWAGHGFIERVVRDAATWVEARKVPGLTLEVVRLPGRTPVIFFEIEGTKPGCTGSSGSRAFMGVSWAARQWKRAISLSRPAHQRASRSQAPA